MLGSSPTLLGVRPAESLDDRPGAIEGSRDARMTCSDDMSGKRRLPSMLILREDSHPNREEPTYRLSNSCCNPRPRDLRGECRTAAKEEVAVAVRSALVPRIKSAPPRRMCCRIAAMASDLRLAIPFRHRCARKGALRPPATVWFINQVKRNDLAQGSQMF